MYKPLALLLTTILSLSAMGGEAPQVEKHVVVYQEEGRFAGWPANHGMWSWGDEILFGFVLGHHLDNPEGHQIDSEKGSTLRNARSLDGGETWTIEVPNYLDENGKVREATELTKKIDFTHPDFAMKLTGGTFFYTYDRGHLWEGPFNLPDFGRSGLLARTDYIVNGKRDMQIFLASNKDEGGEGWPFCARTRDGGLSWEHVGWIGPQPGEGGYAIMPATVRLSDTSLLSIIRNRERIEDESRWWIHTYLSPDDGASWYLLDGLNIDNRGNPAAIIRLQDDRIAMVYGHRGAPYGIRARISEDNGVTWGEDIMLREDGSDWDIGYPRTVQRADGKIVSVYYFSDKDHKERYIAATIWDPGTK